MIQIVTRKQVLLKGKPSEIQNYINEISRQHFYLLDFINSVQAESLTRRQFHRQHKPL